VVQFSGSTILGDVCAAWNQWDKAIDCWERALEIFKEIGDCLGERLAIANLEMATRNL
jgi:hypothetical protein